MFEAHQIFEDETSKDTGLPMWLGGVDDPAIIFVPEERMDRASAAKAEWEENEGKRKKKRHGIRMFVKPVNAETGEDLVYGGAKREEIFLAASQVERDLDGLIERDRPERGYNPADYGDGVTDPAT